MTDIAPLIALLKREFPLPEADPAWVRECVQALLEDGQDASIATVREQYLFSDLSFSTLPSRVFPSEAHNIILCPRPTLVQILAVAEIGASAFQLQTTLEQRRDVLEGATRIRRMGEEENDEEVEEGKMPAYPRSMLRLDLSDGRRVMKAIEYRSIMELQLGETALGAKVSAIRIFPSLTSQLLVHNVRALRGTLLLSPQNTRVLGYQVDHLEAEQSMHFVAGLAKRLGKPLSGAVKDEDPVRITQPYNQPRAAQSQAQTEGRRRLTLPTQQPAAVTKSRQEFADDEDDDDFDVDDSFMRRLEEVEAKAVKRAKLSNRDDEGRPERMEVIEISD